MTLALPKEPDPPFVLGDLVEVIDVTSKFYGRLGHIQRVLSFDPSRPWYVGFTLYQHGSFSRKQLRKLRP